MNSWHINHTGTFYTNPNISNPIQSNQLTQINSLTLHSWHHSRHAYHPPLVSSSRWTIENYNCCWQVTSGDPKCKSAMNASCLRKGHMSYCSIHLTTLKVRGKEAKNAGNVWKSARWKLLLPRMKSCWQRKLSGKLFYRKMTLWAGKERTASLEPAFLASPLLSEGMQLLHFLYAGNKILCGCCKLKLLLGISTAPRFLAIQKSFWKEQIRRKVGAKGRQLQVFFP